MYNAAYGNRWIPMRSIRTKTASYIWNPWSDGKTIYQTENMAGLTWKAMLAASATNAAIKARTDLYSYRVPEEFYDLTSDRFERKNLISDPARQKQIEAMRQELLALMRRTGDPFAEAFAQRDNREATVAVLKKLKEEYGKKGE
jgi:N-sulfoglucosamine sulfohydrolase